MRSNFDAQLGLLNRMLTEMGEMCEGAISGAVRAMLTCDKELAEKTASSDISINRSEKEIESLCLKLLLEQQPVARDLRFISSALKMITDMERIGDQAADISEIIMFSDALSDTDLALPARMGRVAAVMVNESVSAFVTKDLRLARKVMNDDDEVDRLFVTVRDSVIDRALDISGNDEKARRELCAAAVDTLMIAKYLERIGDHAVNLAEWVEFSILGERFFNNLRE